MGSNPISPTIIVLDTSPLQALHRVALLPVLRAVFEQILVPRAVYEETQASLPLARAGMVPDLEQFPWIEVREIGNNDIASAGAVLVKQRRSTELYKWFDRQIDRPEVEAIILARRESALAIIEDSKGVKCARNLGVTLMNVADLLLEFERGHHIPDASLCATTIMETGYHSKELRWLSWRQPSIK